MSIIIGIDHGYYAIKTAHCSFPAGLTSYGEHEPYTRQGLLEFGGCFFVCGSGRQPIQRDKTVNDNYYLLTLAAIAKEIKQRGLPPECSVRIAAGLPLTSFGRDKPKFRDYLLRSKEDILFAALKVNPARIDSYCQAVDEPILEEIRKLPSGASMDQLKDRWYRGRDGSDYHYHQSRYHALNLHSVFYHGTVEWRLFNSTLHAGEAKANIILAMAISAQGINQKYTQFRKTPIGDNPAFTFRTFLLRLGLIGPEYKNVRMHLLKNLPGDKAWRHDKSLYPSNQPRPRTDEAR